jgi:hypothetical protein
MKPIQQTSYYQSFRPLKLHREDVDEVLSMLTQAGCKITLSDDAKVYDSLDEMRSYAGTKVKALHIKGSQPSASLSFGGHRLNWLYWADENNAYVENSRPENEWLFLKIRDFLRARQRILPKLINVPGVWLIGILFPVWRWFISSRHISDEVKQFNNIFTFVFQIAYFGAWMIFFSQGWTVLSLESRRHTQVFAFFRSRLLA